MTTVTYDSTGRMKYHPDYHPNHGKPYTTQELSYLCKMYEGHGNRKRMSMALGRTEASLASLVHHLRKSGKFDQFKNL